MSRSSVLAALFVSTAALAAPAAPVIPTLENYRVGDYTYCDVHVLARTWGIDEAAASERISTKVVAGNAAAVKATLESGRGAITFDGWSTCPYHEAGYSYDDAEALGRAWGVDTQEAKARIERKIAYKIDGGLRAEIAAAPPVPVAAPVVPPAGYNQCDAQVLAAHWGIAADQAAESMQMKVSSGNSALLATVMKEARAAKGGDTSLCQFWQQEVYSYDDAETLATLWKVDVSEAKARLETAARTGQLAKVNKALKR